MCDRELSREEFIKLITTDPLSLIEFAKILNTTVDEILTLAYNVDNKWILITKPDCSRVLYKLNDKTQWDILYFGKPKEFEFIGFQHSQEGITFWAYTVMDTFSWNKLRG